MVVVLDSRGPATDEELGEAVDVGTGASGVLGLFTPIFFTLPTRTTIARAGVAVWALALFRKVEPTLNVLFAGLGGRMSPELYLS